ncbi:conserved hypothetical protein [Ricinus communis]|uniref:Uncharacterized protein n=1 Tax=Ricinus communis TaxID=3988 RepID=B9SVR7_RICCO|nr:conserved hypothetical protein [Ricinus communis]
MATGLQQFYFFPTDFLYPRPQVQQSIRVDTAQKKAALPLQIQKRDRVSDDHTKHPSSLSLVLYNNKIANKASVTITKSNT